MFNFRCKRDILEHLATCTDPHTRLNTLYGDSPFCPYPPSVSIDKSLSISASNSEPLEFMSYYVDERLMEMAESEDIVEFFRKYMAGFVISKRESAVSRCGSIKNDIDNSSDVDIPDLMCFMFSTTPVVRNESSLFADSISRQYRIDDFPCGRFQPFLTYDSMVSCLYHNFIFEYENSGIVHAQYPNCSNVVLNVSTVSFEIGQNTTNTMMIDNNFEVDGTIRRLSGDTNVGGEPTVGRVYGSNTEIMAATVYYNNQVIYCYHCNVIYIYSLLLSLSTCRLLH